jgi:hypothetical protein
MLVRGFDDDAEACLGSFPDPVSNVICADNLTISGRAHVFCVVVQPAAKAIVVSHRAGHYGGGAYDRGNHMHLSFGLFQPM